MAKKNEAQAPQMESLSKMETFITKYKKVISIAIIAIVVVVVGGILLNNFYFQPRQAEASTALAKGQDYFAQQQYEKALNGDKAGYDGFLKIADKYSCTDAGNLAHLYAGLSYAALNKWKEAADCLEDYSSADDAMISPAAEAALGNAYANLGKIDDAVDCLKKAADMANDQSINGYNMSLSPSFLLQAGELLESQGKADKALEIYQDIKKNYINSPVYREIDKYIERCSK